MIPAYERDPKEIYRQSFAAIRAEAELDGYDADEREVAIRLIHACGMVDLTRDLKFSGKPVAAARLALAAGSPVLCDVETVASGIIRSRLPRGCDIVVTLNDPRTAERAARQGTTRSAAAVELWIDRLDGAIAVIGNAPTALFRLIELIEAGAPRPAAVLGFPVGFVGAAEAKQALVELGRGIPFITVTGRRGGSALASAAVNGIAAGLVEGSE